MKKIKNLFWILLIFLIGMLSSCSEYPITPIEQKPIGIFKTVEFTREIIKGDTVRKIIVMVNGKIEKETIY